MDILDTFIRSIWIYFRKHIPIFLVKGVTLKVKVNSKDTLMKGESKDNPLLIFISTYMKYLVDLERHVWQSSLTTKQIN